MKKKYYKSILLISSVFASYSVQSVGAGLSESTIATINDEVGSAVSVSALEGVINDVNASNGSKLSSSFSGTIGGSSVRAYLPSGTTFNGLSVGRLTSGQETANITNKNSGASERLVVEVDGVTVFDGSTVDRATLLDIARTFNILPFLNTATSTSLASTSASGASSQIIWGNVNAQVLSHKQLRAMANRPSSYFLMSDLRYEQGRFTKSKDDGDIKGATMSMATEIGGVELGAYIPYDYIDFESFNAHRTGTVLYAKRNWQLPHSLQLSTLANFNYLATYVSELSLTNTVGGGFGTSISYDNGGDFVPRVSFALQYNQDFYYKAQSYIKDDHQLLTKSGVSLGYRLFENTTLNAGFGYTNDVTSYKSASNKLKDTDYFDITVGGSIAISDMWQASLSYKRLLGLDTYYSNTVYLGTTLGF
jgi:hypothetical protein